MKLRQTTVVMLFSVTVLISNAARGGAVSSAAREAAETVAEKVYGKAAQDLLEQSAEKMGREAAEDAGCKMLQDEAASLAPRIERLLVANGKDAAPFVQKTGLRESKPLKRPGRMAKTSLSSLHGRVTRRCGS